MLQKNNKKKKKTANKQQGHDGPEIAHLYIGPWGGANIHPGAFI
jgi:hypothetical protein